MAAGTRLISLKMDKAKIKPFRAQQVFAHRSDFTSSALREQAVSSQVTRRPRPFVKPIGYCYIHYLALGILIGCCECQSFSASALDASNLCCSEQPVFAHVMIGDLVCMS